MEEETYEYCQTEKWLDVRRAIRIIFKQRLRLQSEFQNFKRKWATKTEIYEISSGVCCKYADSFLFGHSMHE